MAELREERNEMLQWIFVIVMRRITDGDVVAEIALVLDKSMPKRECEHSSSTPPN